MRGARLFLTLAVLFSLLVFVLLGCGAQECPPCPECDPNDFTWEEIEEAIGRLPYATPGPESMYAVERIGIKTYEDSSFYSGADLYFYSDEWTTQKMHIAGATGNIDGEGTLNVAGATTFGGKLTLNDQVLIDGSADEIQLQVQGYTTQTNGLMVLEQHDGTDVLTVSNAGNTVVVGTLTATGATALNGGLAMDTNKFTVADTTGNTVVAGTFGASTDVFVVSPAPAAGSGGDLVDVTDTFGIANGSDAMIGIDVNLTGANHTGGSNTLVGLDLGLTTPDADATESAILLTDTDWDYGIQSVVDQENYFLPSIRSSTITTDTTDMFTVGATEIWFVHSFYCNFTSNFDCTGGNCTLVIGDGSDTDGFAVYVDAEMQTGDTEVTGAPAGWQGFGSTDTVGAYLAQGLGFVYTNDGIDADFGGTGVQNGSATCYIVYTKIHE